MSLPDDARALAARIGHDFADPALLVAALTHPSAKASRSAGPVRYERLEFLGDRVLGLVVAELLVERYPAEDEGALSKRLMAVVRREALVEVGLKIGLGDVLRLAGVRRSLDDPTYATALADGGEALIGALYLDGGLDVARRFVREHWAPLVTASRRPPKDPKTSLQEWAQARGLALPAYELISAEGPSHAPDFRVRVSLTDGHTAEAAGRSKRAAEKVAATRLLALLEDGT